MTSPKQPHDSDVQRLLGEHYEEVEMEATFRMALLDRTRQAAAARARPRYRWTLAFAAMAAAVVAACGLWAAYHRPVAMPATAPAVSPTAPLVSAPQGVPAGAQVAVAAGGKQEKVMQQASVLPAAGGGQGRRGPRAAGASVRPPAGQPLLVVITRRGEARDGGGRSLKVGDQLSAGATVRTGKASYLVMVTRKGSGLALDANSELAVARDGKSAALRKGQVYCRNWKHEFAAVTTPAGKIHLLGTVVDAVMKSKDKVTVTVVEGRVKLANAHGTALVSAGRKATLIASAAPDDGAVANVLAETAWVEGCLYFSSAENSGAGWNSGVVRHVLIGSVVTDEGMPSADADPSPADGTIVWADSQADVHATDERIFVRKPDGDLDLTERAGLSGVNCKPRWSPDGTMISFQHSDAAGDKPVCDYGFQVWVMNADGSNARPVAPPDVPSHYGARWTPDGQHLLVEVKASEPTVCRVDLSGQTWEKLPAAISEAVWSPDGQFLVGITWPQGTQDGKPGQWRQLVLADALGNNPQVLVQHFIAYADVAPYYPTEEQKKNAPDRNWVADLCYHVGPSTPQWSPSGDQIAFTAALPFDPAGPYYNEQRQVWIYDLNAEKLVQVTYDSGGKYALVWSSNPLPVGEGSGGGGGGGG
jgi:hypothetical protein